MRLIVKESRKALLQGVPFLSLAGTEMSGCPVHKRYGSARYQPFPESDENRILNRNSDNKYGVCYAIWIWSRPRHILDA